MDARCYNGSKNRTKYKKLTFKFRDFISVFITAAVFTAVIFANIYLGGIV
jgi:energy-coupling factor transporter transmembrane protein EcfT